MIHLYMNRLIRYALPTGTNRYQPLHRTISVVHLHCTTLLVHLLYYLTNTPIRCNATIYPTGVFGDPTRVFGDHPRAIFEETKVVNIIK
jgi:hypothetical protein